MLWKLCLVIVAPHGLNHLINIVCYYSLVFTNACMYMPSISYARADLFRSASFLFMLAILCVQKPERHLHAFPLTGVIIEEEGCHHTSRLIVPNFSCCQNNTLGHSCIGMGIIQFQVSNGSLVNFSLLGSAAEILKEWNVTGKKKVRIRMIVSSCVFMLALRELN